jgi:predicted glycoside hydrolase/deacetylase ChbG (UPF0249 family)
LRFGSAGVHFLATFAGLHAAPQFFAALDATTRYLIVNADDFGLTDGVNQGIIEAHEHGIVTSASLMVRAPAAENAAALARSHPRLGLGLHIDIGEWILRDGEWITRYERVAEGDAAAAAAELEEQVSLFVRLTGAFPDHLDSHQHVHRARPEVADAAGAIAGRLGVGVRGADPRVTYGGLYGQDGDGRTVATAIAPDAYVEAIKKLGAGITELGCHPGYADGLESDYGMEREVEVTSLCDARVRQAIVAGAVRLVTWRDAKALAPA